MFGVPSFDQHPVSTAIDIKQVVQLLQTVFFVGPRAWSIFLCSTPLRRRRIIISSFFKNYANSTALATPLTGYFHVFRAAQEERHRVRREHLRRFAIQDFEVDLPVRVEDASHPGLPLRAWNNDYLPGEQQHERERWERDLRVATRAAGAGTRTSHPKLFGFWIHRTGCNSRILFLVQGGKVCAGREGESDRLLHWQATGLSNIFSCPLRRSYQRRHARTLRRQLSRMDTLQCRPNTLASKGLFPVGPIVDFSKGDPKDFFQGGHAVVKFHFTNSKLKK